MSKISEEIRMFVKRSYADEHMDPKELIALADRIDAEMVELPLAADKKPIKPNQTVYSKLGKEYRVINVLLRDGVGTVHCEPRFGGIAEFVPDSYFSPQDLTHERPDSFERIADELDEQAGSLTKDGYTWQEDAIHDFADRIRKLAAKEGE